MVDDIRLLRFEVNRQEWERLKTYAGRQRLRAIRGANSYDLRSF